MEASDRDFAADINKNPDRTEDQVGMLPDRVLHLFSDFVLGGLHLRQLETADGDGQHKSASLKK